MASVRFYDDYIAVLDRSKREIIGWHMDEWIEDPDVVFSLVNAVRLAFMNETKLKRDLRAFQLQPYRKMGARDA